MSIFFPTLLASGAYMGDVLLYFFGGILASGVGAITAIAQLIYMAKSFKPDSEKAQRRTRTFAKINLSIGIICFVVLCLMQITNQVEILMVVPTVVQLTLGIIGRSLVKEPSSKAVSWAKKNTYLSAVKIAFLTVGCLVIANILSPNFIDSFRSIHVGGIDSLQISPDNKTFVTSGNNTIRIWDLATGKHMAKFRHKDVSEVSFSHNGKMLGSYDYTNDEVKLWDIEKKKVIATTKGNTFLGFSQNNKTILVSGSRGIHFLNIATKKTIKAVPLPGVSSFNLSSNGKILFIVGDKKIDFWDANNGKLVKTINDSYDNFMISPSGKFFAYNYTTKKDKKIIKIHNIVNNTSKTLQGDFLFFSSDEKSLFTDDWQLIDIASGKTLWKISKGRNDLTPILHSNAKTLIGAYTFKRKRWALKIWKNGMESRTLKSSSLKLYTKLKLDNTGGKLITVQHQDKYHARIFNAWFTNTITVWDINTGKALYTIKGFFD